MAVGTNGKRISRADLEAAFSQVIGETEATAQARLPRWRSSPGRRSWSC